MDVVVEILGDVFVWVYVEVVNFGKVFFDCGDGVVGVVVVDNEDLDVWIVYVVD